MLVHVHLCIAIGCSGIHAVYSLHICTLPICSFSVPQDIWDNLHISHCAWIDVLYVKQCLCVAILASFSSAQHFAARGIILFADELHNTSFTPVLVLLLQLFLLRSFGHIHLAVYIGKIKIAAWLPLSSNTTECCTCMYIYIYVRLIVARNQYS